VGGGVKNEMNRKEILEILEFIRYVEII